jgi:iron complex outermembrane recepter protein
MHSAPPPHATILALVLSILGPTARAQTETGPGVSSLDVVQVTADAFQEEVQEVPNSIDVIEAAELRARGVNDLRTALSLLGGVTVALGGDEGPAAAVPGLLGLREVDDFLLLIDGVPAGGVFIPQFATLTLANVARIEVQRGTAPVLYGTTAFAGTINVIPYPAGAADKRVNLAYGTYGSLEANGSTVLAQSSTYRASLTADGARERYSDPRLGLNRGHLLLRNAADVGGGELRLDGDATLQWQQPSSPRPLEGARFDPEVPIDFNQNPADAKIDTRRFQLTTAYDKTMRLGSWTTTLSVTHTRTDLIQGFLNEDSDPGDGEGNATGFSQSRHLTEVYLDTHLTHRFNDALVATVGAAELYGNVHQDSQTFSYTVPQQRTPDRSDAGTPGDSSHLADWRSFAGLYAQGRWNLTPRVGLLAGLRLNRIDESRTAGEEGEADDNTSEQHSSITRLSGSLGINARIWQDPQAALDDVVLYASYGNTFQPAQIDFGPEDTTPTAPLLPPETAHSYEAGIKADADDGRFSADLSLFWVDFANQAIATQVDNTPTLTAGGRERFKGIELELRFRPAEHFAVSANYSYNDARYVDFETVIDGERLQLANNQLVLSPQHLAAVGLTYSAPRGIQASLVSNVVGARFLDSQNEIRASAYLTVDATLGYAFRTGWTLSLNAYNLTDRRDPVLESELGEGQFYLMPARRVFVKFSVPL